MWRKLAKDGKIKIAEYNNKTKIINGVEHYTFVVQLYDGDKFSESNSFDPLGLFILGEMVDGYILISINSNQRKIARKYTNML